MRKLSVAQQRLQAVLSENFDLFDFTLTDEQISRLDGLDRGVRTGPDPEQPRDLWDMAIPEA